MTGDMLHRGSLSLYQDSSVHFTCPDGVACLLSDFDEELCSLPLLVVESVSVGQQSGTVASCGQAVGVSAGRTVKFALLTCLYAERPFRTWNVLLFVL